MEIKKEVDLFFNIQFIHYTVTAVLLLYITNFKNHIQLLCDRKKIKV